MTYCALIVILLLTKVILNLLYKGQLESYERGIIWKSFYVAANLMNKILFIVEGKNDEVIYIKRLFEKCNVLQKYEIISYNTNLHNLANSLIKNDEIDPSLDIRYVLKENETDVAKKEILSQEFSDIILVFDFEPQQDVPRFEQIRKLLEFFNKSTENGKLYINYPMMQSYRHFDKLPSKEFKDLTVTKKDAKKYKELVGSVSNFTNVGHHSYSLFVSIAYHHLLKLNYILNKKYELPDKAWLDSWNQLDLFDIQYKLLQDEGYIYVINTFALFLIEYNPSDFYNQIKKHKSKYSI